MLRLDSDIGDYDYELSLEMKRQKIQRELMKLEQENLDKREEIVIKKDEAPAKLRAAAIPKANDSFYIFIYLFAKRAGTFVQSTSAIWSLHDLESCLSSVLPRNLRSSQLLRIRPGSPADPPNTKVETKARAQGRRRRRHLCPPLSLNLPGQHLSFESKKYF